LEQLILEYIKKNNLISENDKVLVAVSGGPDSMCLLNILYNLKDNLKIELFVAHVNHLIRSDAKEDAKYVEEFCKTKNIPFFLKECNVLEEAKTERIGVEEAGRKVRYSFFQEISEKNNINKIAIGHNKNDLAETLIMNILRGSGPQGLKSITCISNDNLCKNKKISYIRPLLETDREKIEGYCKDNYLEPRIDSTNLDNNYTRNRIRNVVIPYIKKEFNPNIVETLVRLSEIVTEEQNYIEQEVDKQYNIVLEKELNNSIIISGKRFSALNIAIKRKLILYIVKKLFGTTKQIEKKHIEDVIKLIDKNIGNKYLMVNKNLKVSIKKGIVLIEKLK